MQTILFVQASRAVLLLPIRENGAREINRERLPERRSGRLYDLKFHRVNRRRNIRKWPETSRERERERKAEERMSLLGECVTPGRRFPPQNTRNKTIWLR